MPVKYTKLLSETHSWTAFLLLFRWKGSVFKLVLTDGIVYLLFYAVISITYRSLLFDQDFMVTRVFDFLVMYSRELMNRIPIAFVLGFYVSNVVTWWQNQYNSLPWPDDIALQLAAFMQGTSEDIVIRRRTIVRYVNLSMILAFRGISISAKNRFPDLKSLEKSGLVTADESKLIEMIDDTYNKFYVPLIWAANLIHSSRRKKYLSDNRQLDSLIETLSGFRQNLGDLFVHQWINPPLVYTQVATITVYLYFFTSLIAWQFVGVEDYYFPFFGILQFIFYMGWLKVAENLLYPFGDDDDDFDVIYLIERNVQMAYLLVDDMHKKHPNIIPDELCDLHMDTSKTIFHIEEMDKEDDFEVEENEDIIITQVVSDYEIKKRNI